MGQDPIEYGTHTWHTNLDTYERILEDDVKKDAMVVAWAVYQLAMRDELLPRFAKTDMPPKPPRKQRRNPRLLRRVQTLRQSLRQRRKSRGRLVHDAEDDN